MQHGKREFLKAAAGVAALAAVPRTAAQTAAPWQPSQRYPDPSVRIVDPSFGRYRLGLAKVERIASGMRWNEGPVWFGDGRYLPRTASAWTLTATSGWAGAWQRGARRRQHLQQRSEAHRAHRPARALRQRVLRRRPPQLPVHGREHLGLFALREHAGRGRRLNRFVREERMIDHRTAPYAALFLRLSLSFLFFAHLYRKFAIIGFDSWWSGLQKAGYADWMLSYTLVAEFAGAILLPLGVYSRYVSLFAMPVMIALVYHWAVRKGFWFSDGGLEFVLAWLMMLIGQALLGDGAYAVRVPALPWDRTGQQQPLAA
jgi:putative oxidoreductase